MKRYLVLLLVLLLVPAVALASYNYSANVQVGNTGSTQTDVAVLATVNLSQVATMGYMQSNALDTALKEGTTDYVYMPASDRLAVYVPSLSSGQTRTLSFQTGYSTPKTEFPIIAGNSGYVSTADNSSLEPGSSDFEVEWSGYFDATKTGNILAKGGEYGIISSTAGTVQAFSGNGTTTSQNLLPNAAGNYNQWSIYPSGTAWEAIDDPVGVPDDDTTYIYTGSSNYYTSVNIASPTTLAGSYISSVQVFFRSRYYGSVDTPAVFPFLRLGGINQIGSSYTTTSSYVDQTQTISRPGGGGWSVSDLADLEVGVVGNGTANAAVRVTQLYVIVNYTPPNTGVSAAATTGVRKFKAVRTGASIELFFDTGSGYVSQGTGTATDPSNLGSTVVSSGNGPCSYTTFSKITIGTQQLWYQPVAMISSASVPDRSPGGTNTGTITWGTNLSGVTGTVLAFTSSTEYEAEPSGGDTTPPDVMGTATAPGGYVQFPTGSVPGNLPNLPAYDLFRQAAIPLFNAGTEDEIISATASLYSIAMLMVAIALGVTGFIMTGSLMTAGLFTGVTMFAGTVTGVLSAWIFIFYIILGGAYVYVARQM